MARYAEVTDVAARFARELSADEQARAETLIESASVYIEALARTDDEAALREVCVNLVVRAMGASEDTYGATSMTTAAGPYSETRTYSSPVGDFYLTRLDRRLLGMGGSIGFARPSYGRLEASDD
jgi:phosphoglucomutase